MVSVSCSPPEVDPFVDESWQRVIFSQSDLFTTSLNMIWPCFSDSHLATFIVHHPAFNIIHFGINAQAIID